MVWSDEQFTALGLTPPPSRTPIPGGPQTVADILAAPLRERPDAQALIGRDVCYSYADLDKAATAAAAVLARLGVEPGDRVAASTWNHPDLVIACLGAQRIGAIWVGVNRALAPPEKAYLLKDAGASILLIDPVGRAGLEPLLAELPDLQHVVEMRGTGEGDAWAELMRQAAGALAPTVEIDPFAPAFISYTSGTTGFPKGVVHSQHNAALIGAAAVARREWDCGLRRGCAQPLTINNLMIRFALQTFCSGGAFVCMDRLDSRGIVDWVRDKQVQTFSAVATMLQDILFDPTIDKADLRSLIRPIVGAANLPDSVREEFRRRFGTGVQFTYGLTEGPTGVTQTDPSEPFTPGSSGRAMPHLQVAIFSADGVRLGAREEGEICVGPQKSGPWADVYTPTLGYWRNPEATARTLVDGWLHTGDMGVIDAQGRLFVRDRRSDLINRGGANVYPAEVERVLGGDERVRASAVFGLPHARLGETVAAVIELAPGYAAAALARDLQALCAQNLARYKIPELWFSVDHMPRNAMNKIVKPQLKAMLQAGDLTALPAPERGAGKTDTNAAAPAG